MNNSYLNHLSSKIIYCAIEVHKELGPGLLESVYQKCLAFEFYSNKVLAMQQVCVPIEYKGNVIDKDYYIDFLVENEIVVELKAVEILLPVHEVQLVTYLKLANKKLGLLINFNVPVIKSGIRRKVNNL